MSSINYDNNNNNQIPLQDPNAPPRLPTDIPRRGGVLGRNDYNNIGRNDYNDYIRPNDYIGPNDYVGRNDNLGPNNCIGPNDYVGRNYNLGPNDYIRRNDNIGRNDYIGRNGYIGPINNRGPIDNIGRNVYVGPNDYIRRNDYIRGNDYVGRNNNYNRGNRFYNRNFYNQNYQRNRRNFYNRNYRNRNYRIPRQNSNLYDRGGYGFVSPGQGQEQTVRPPGRRRLGNGPRRQGPRQIRLNDFMPTELREPSPNLPPDFNIATTTAPAITNVNAPSDALPQRERFVQNNTTQPFTVTGNNQNKQLQQQPNQRQRKTTSSFRRRQRRNNRFAMLADENDNLSDVEAEVKDDSMPLNTNKKLRKVKNSKKTSRYLEPTRILKWLEDHSRSSKNAI
ncbi:unnamed protein product, partial [Rotaria sp. Silwood2]